MDIKGIRAAITYELKAAEKEHNPAAELMELEMWLSMELKRVRRHIKAIPSNDPTEHYVDQFSVDEDVEPIQMPFPPAR